MTIKKDNQIILGIDPGLASTGYGLIEKQKPAQNLDQRPIRLCRNLASGRNNVSLVDFGCVTTSLKESHPIRLKQIHDNLKKIIQRYKPVLITIEQLFFAKNVKTALKIGEVRGIIQFTAVECKTPIQEFTPLQIKQALTGYGRADKNQVQQMVKNELGLSEIPKPNHAADALAVAITCAYTNPNLKSKI